MNRIFTWGPAAALVSALALASMPLGGCGSDGGDDQPADGPCTANKSMCMTLHVPDDYAATPVKIIAGFYDSLPPSGPPAGVAKIVDNPAIAAGMPFEFEADEMMTSGDYFVYVVLYNEGGGNFVPVSGVDYVVQSASKVHVGGGPVNLGDMTVSLYQE